MKAEAVWAAAPTGEGAPTWDTRQRAVLLNHELEGTQAAGFSTQLLLWQIWQVGALGFFGIQQILDIFLSKAFNNFRLRKRWKYKTGSNKFLFIFFKCSFETTATVQCL